MSEYESKNICLQFDKGTDERLASELSKKMNDFALKFDNISLLTSNTIGTSYPNLDIELNKQFTSKNLAIERYIHLRESGAVVPQLRA